MAKGAKPRQLSRGAQALVGALALVIVLVSQRRVQLAAVDTAPPSSQEWGPAAAAAAAAPSGPHRSLANRSATIDGNERRVVPDCKLDLDQGPFARNCTALRDVCVDQVCKPERRCGLPLLHHPHGSAALRCCTEQTGLPCQWQSPPPCHHSAPGPHHRVRPQVPPAAVQRPARRHPQDRQRPTQPRLPLHLLELGGAACIAPLWVLHVLRPRQRLPLHAAACTARLWVLRALKCMLTCGSAVARQHSSQHPVRSTRLFHLHRRP